MASVTVTKTIGSTGTFSTLQLWEDGGPADLTTAEQSAAGTFAVASFIQGEPLTFVGSGATGTFLHTDSTGPGNGTFITYGIITGNPAASDTVTGDTSGATCILSSGTADFVGVIWRGECQNQEFTVAGPSTLLTTNGSTSSATAYKEVTTVAGASFRDRENVQTNALHYNAANGCGLSTSATNAICVELVEAFARISNLQIKSTGSGSSSLRLSGSSTVGEFIIAEGVTISTAATNGVVSAIGAATLKNSVVVQRATGASHIIGTNFGSPNFYNCTIVAPDDLATAPTSVFLSAASSTGTVTVQNCGLFAGDSTKAIKAGSATFNFTTCYSDISGTSGVTQTTYGNEFQNVNDASRDFRLKLGAAQHEAGTTDATNAAIDIAKTNRPYGTFYDVGAWEFIPTFTGGQAPGEDDGDFFLITQAAV